MTKPIEIDGGSQFFKDLEDTECTGINRGVYNLICTMRDLKLYSKGIKPHRRWKVTNVKDYFGLKGNAKKLLNDITVLHNIVIKEVNL